MSLPWRSIPHRTKYRAVIISPHLDDAVFSCAATIARFAQEGPVLVVNIFTRYLSDLKVRGVVMNNKRFLEEHEAAAALGFESCCLDELDAVFRRQEYRSIGNVFRPPVPEDWQWLPELRERLTRLLGMLAFDTLLIPLGIGWHVDHILSFEALHQWQAPSDVLFYEDVPYTLFAHAARLRLRETGAIDLDSGGRALLVASLASDWRTTARQYLGTAMMQNIKPALLRWLAIPPVSWYLRSLLKLHAEPRPDAENWRWTAEAHAGGMGVVEKVEAMAIYQSQFREFFLDNDDCGRMLNQHVATFGQQGQFAERLWRRTPALCS